MNKQTAVDWLSNQAYELFEQYSEGNFDRIQLNKLMVDATNKAKEKEKEQIIKARLSLDKSDNIWDKEIALEISEQYYNETYKQD
jgi:hypothetical protein